MAQLAQIPEERRVYIDECGINTPLVREHGRAERGVKVEDTKPGKKYARTNIVAAQVHEKDGVQKLAPFCYQSSMNGELFERWVKETLLPVLKAGSTLIMDNASFHRKTKLEEILKGTTISLLYLPPYSPDLNPIEKSWANMKRELRGAAPLGELLQTAIYAYWH